MNNKANIQKRIIVILVHFLLFVFLIVFTPSCLYTQELEIHNNRYYNSGNGEYTAQKYNDRYDLSNDITFTLYNTSFYKLKKVKKIELFDDDHRLYWMMELDTFGNIIKQGQLGSRYFITTQSFKRDESSHTMVTHYFLNRQLWRVDTSVSTHLSFKNADTVIHFTRTILKSYKKGSLINEQNDYYNKLPITGFNGHFFSSDYKTNKNGKTIHQTQIKAKQKTNYDTGIIYLSRIEIMDDEFYSSADSAKKIILFDQLTKHPSGKKYNPHTLNCITEGECFVEPVRFVKSNICGYSIYKEMESYKTTRYSYSSNAKGLHENYISTHAASDKTESPKSYVVFTFKYEYYE